jgi:hypothetical protein
MTEVERICRDIVRAGEGTLSWEWDDRFQMALAAFSSGHEAHVAQILQADLRSTWRADTVGQAPALVRQIAKAMGLRSGQMLLCTEGNEDPLLFCAWWPWGGGKTISIRIGVVAAAPGDHANAIKTWFGL